MSTGFMKDGKLVTAATKDDMNAEVAAREEADAELQKQLDTIGASDYTVDTETGAYHVYTAAGLQAWATACSENVATDCVLMRDIDMADITWTPIGSNTNPYTGTFEGSGHTILNLNIDPEATTYTGFLGGLGSGGIVQNLILSNLTIPEARYAGGIVGSSHGGSILNCKVSGSITCSIYGGGILCYSSGSNNIVSGCTNSATIKTENSNQSARVGGIAASVNYALITSCTNSGTVTNDYDMSTSSVAGGIVGYSSNTAICNCSNTGIVTGTGRTGGIVGDSTQTQISNCTNTSTLNASTTQDTTVEVGGLAGRCEYGNISSSANYASIAAANDSSSYYTRAGGIVGYISGATSSIGSINACLNRGSVTTSGSATAYIGSIYGYKSTSNVTLEANVNAVYGLSDGGN